MRCCGLILTPSGSTSPNVCSPSSMEGSNNEKPPNLPFPAAGPHCYKMTMRRHQVMAAVSSAQLALGLAGLAVAVRRRHAFDLPGWRGSPDHIARDAAWMGTALSAPAPMLVAQAVSAAALTRGDSAAAKATTRGLGLAMCVGYPIERHVRHRLTRRGWHRQESPIAIAGWSLAAAMVAVGGPLRPVASRT